MYTLLECVQILLNSMESDEVDSINDTVESRDVALLLKTVFFDIASDLGLPQQDTLLELNASGDNAKPVLMTAPSTTTRIDWIKYDNREDGDTRAFYKPVTYLPFPEFIEMMSGYVEDTTGTAQMSFTQNGETFEVVYRTDKHPTYYTTTDDHQIIFDSLDISLDTTLQKSKTMAFGQTFPVWTMEDSFTPPLTNDQFSYFLNKAKARAFNERKQLVNQEATAEARRQKIVLQRKKEVIKREPAIMQAPRYGRK